MRKNAQLLIAFVILLLQGFTAQSQDIDFNLRYNGVTDAYEVYARPDFSTTLYFVGGGSQISILLPEAISDAPIGITSINGGFWSDNSQVYAPIADPNHDYHGIATNGASIVFVEGEEILLFTFTLTGGCIPGLRIFENDLDPPSSAPGMGGGDYLNFFASVFDPFTDNYNANYENDAAVCPEPPTVIPNALTIPTDSTGNICMPISDLNTFDTFTASICSGSPEEGTATATVNGSEVCLEYVPTAGFAGEDAVCLVVCDQTGLCDTVQVPITVVAPIPPNLNPEPPMVVVTPITVPQDSTASVCTVILDPNAGDTFTASLCTDSPENGTASPTVDGSALCLEYTPNIGFTGSDSICVIVCDQGLLCDTISVPVTVVPSLLPVDSTQAPVVVFPPIVGPEDSTTVTCGAIIDGNPGDTFTSTICEDPSNGTASAAVNNTTDQLCITFEPNAGFVGEDSICVIVCDQTNLCDTIQIPIIVQEVNDPPLAINDINTTQIDIPATGNVVTNDTDPEEDNLTVSTTPLNETNGTVTIDTDGNYTFIPTPAFTGTASFEYVVCDDGSPIACDTAEVVIEVIDNTDPDNNDVTGVNDNFITEGDSTLTANVLANDSDPDGDDLIINTTPVTAPTNGTVVINPDGTIEYTPTPGTTGTDEFSYEVCDNGTPVMCDTVTVTIEVLPDNGENDLYATDDASSGNEGESQSGSVTDNDNDPEEGTLTVTTTPLTDVSNGSLTLLADGSYTYVPDANFTGNDQFTYLVCDDGSPVACDSATVYLTVLDVLNPPLVSPNPLTVPMDSTGTVCMPITDLDLGDSFTASICPGSPANGTATAAVNGSEVCLEYTPVASFTGSDDICLIVCDQVGLCDTVQVPVTVVEPLPPSLTPEPPVVVITPILVPEDSTTTVCTVILDPNTGDTFTASLCTGSPANGTASPTVSGNELCLEYTPNTGFTGDDPLCVIVCDQTNLCDTISVPVTVIPTPGPVDSLQPPVVIFPPIVGPEDSTVVACGAIVDPNPGDTFTATICEDPANGTATVAVNNTTDQLCVTLDPVDGFSGADSVCVIVCDQANLCDTINVPVLILEGNDAPIAVDDINSTQEGNPATGVVTTNDTDPEDGELTVNTTPVSETNGTVTIDSEGNYTFTPTPGFVGTASFEYEVCDDGTPVLCDTAEVVIEVLDYEPTENNDVVGMPDNFVTEGDSTLTANVLANDSDPDNDNLVISTTPITAPTNGTLVINPDGTIEYTPTPGTTGTDMFSYQVCDDGSPVMCDTVPVTIEVLPDNGTNDLYATDDANSGTEGMSQSGNVTDNDNDPENGTLTVTTTPLTDVTNGTLTLLGDGTYTYVPDANFTGNDQFTYMVCDDGSPVACDSATVYLTVLDVLNPPLVVPSPLTVPMDSTGTVCMPITDLDLGDSFTASICPGSPANGTATAAVNGSEVCLEYTPIASFTGFDDICLIVCDQVGLCDTVQVPVTVVEPLPPTLTSEPPVVVITPITVPEDSTTNVCTVILDPNTGDTFTASLCTGSPANGTASPTVSGNELCLEYTPNTGFTGDDPLCVIVCDQTNLCDTISVPVTVIPTPGPVDSLQPPVVVFPPIVGPEDSTVVACGAIVDPNPGDTFTTTICGQPANGTVTAAVDNSTDQLCLTFDPGDNFNGSDSVCVIVCDQTNLCDTLTIPIEVISVDEPPVITNAGSAPADTVSYAENATVIVVDFDATDGDGDLEGTGDGDQLDWSITGGTDALAFTINDNGELEFITPPDFETQSEYVVEITVTDSNGDTDVQLLTIMITDVVEGITLNLKVMLHGAMMTSTSSLMQDSLRVKNLIPLAQPYDETANARFTHVQGGTEVTTPAVLAANAGTGDAVVDWVFVEIRDAINSSAVVQTVSALVQRDGDIVAADGGDLILEGLPSSFYVSVKHRNHLGVMTKAPLVVAFSEVTFDFTTATDAELYTNIGYESLAMNTHAGSGLRTLWPGNSNADSKVKYDGGGNDRLIILVNVLSDPSNNEQILNYSNTTGYHYGDINMDGRVKYDGGFNDRVLLQNVVLLYPLNSNYQNNFNLLLEQMPPSP